MNSKILSKHNASHLIIYLKVLTSTFFACLLTVGIDFFLQVSFRHLLSTFFA